MKLLLNNFWGRFAMSSNKSQYRIITDLAEWIQLVSDPEHKVTSADYTNKKYLQVHYRNTNLKQRSLKTNIILASFVTAYARMRLLSEIRKFDPYQILYYDSDSIFFTHKPGQYIPTLGNYLGQLTSEIKLTKGLYILRWVSGGPKNYAYILDSGYKHAVIKGISLNHTTVEVINFESIKNLIQSVEKKHLSVEQLKFRRSVSDWSMHTDIILKKYNFVFDKRIIFYCSTFQQNLSDLQKSKFLINHHIFIIIFY